MSDEFTSFHPTSPRSPLQTAAAVQAGPPISPQGRIYLYDPDEWEEFTREWAAWREKRYTKIEKYGGSGDKGIDVAGFTDADELLGVWDCYQCKHYSHPLNRSDGLKEIAKIIFFSLRGDYAPPRKYRFVAPRGISTAFSQLLSNSVKLREALIEDWPKLVAVLPPGTPPKIGSELSDHLDGYDFTTFGSVPLATLVEEHSHTSFHIARFGGGLGDRPPAPAVPDQIGANEARYTRQLLDAYCDQHGAEVNLSNLGKQKRFKSHFSRSREAFFHAESLRVFVRDKVVPGTFEGLQDQVHAGVADVHEREFSDGFERVLAVVAAAQSLNLSGHALGPSILPTDQRGICHQLANEDRLRWVSK
ncbi:MAG: ABC-three component system protein [Pseudomonadota bacterium]